MPFMLRTACRHATRVMCLNTLERDYLVRRGWVTADRVEVVCHGVAPGFFLPERPHRQARTLLFVGQWLPRKGVEYLREAFTALAHRHAVLRMSASRSRSTSATRSRRGMTVTRGRTTGAKPASTSSAATSVPAQTSLISA